MKRVYSSEKEDLIVEQVNSTVVVPKFDRKNQILVCRIGNEDRPATEKDLIQVKDSFKELRYKDDLTIMVTHHCFDFVIIDRELLKEIPVVAGQFIDREIVDKKEKDANNKIV